MYDQVGDWEAIIHKIVTSSEGDLVGNVDAVDENSILVSTEGGNTKYKIPKEVVEGYDGHEVSLTIKISEIGKFKGAAAEGFRGVK